MLKDESNWPKLGREVQINDDDKPLAARYDN